MSLPEGKKMIDGKLLYGCEMTDFPGGRQAGREGG